MKKFLFSVISVLLILPILLLGLEVIFRIAKGKDLYLQKSTGTKGPDRKTLLEPNRTYTIKENKNNEFDITVKTNSLGYRGKEFARENPKDKVRIFVLGDSFTFGIGAEENETIPYLLEKYLQEKDLPVEVINGGIGGASPIAHFIRTRDIHLQYKPDFVIMLMDFSDMQDDWKAERHSFVNADGDLKLGDSSYINGKRDWWRFLTLHSEFCKYLHRKLVRTFQKIKTLGLKNYIVGKLQGKRAKSLIVNLPETDAIEYDEYLLIRGRNKLPDIQRHFQRTGKYILSLRDLLKQNGTEMMMGIYPYGIHIGPYQWGEGRQYWGFEEGKTYADTYAFDLVMDFAKQNSLFCLNTLSHFLQYKDEELFFNLDGHLTPRGNEILAEALANSPFLLTKIKSIQIKKNI